MSLTDRQDFIVRGFQLDDCEEVQQLYEQVNFYYQLGFYEILLKIDPDAIFVARDTRSGKLLGVCCGGNLSPDLAMIGLYAVKPNCRGLGIGSAIWGKVMEHIGAERNIGLWSLPHMVDKYRHKSKLNIIPERRLIVFNGSPNCNNLIDSIEGISLVPLNEDNIQKVIQYDRQVCDGLDRTVLIREISKTEQTVHLVAINDRNEVLGYCVVWVTVLKTYVVQPLYADNERIAELLVVNCCRLLSNTTTDRLNYCSWDTNQKSIAIAKRLGLEKIRELVLMFSKSVVNGNLDKIYSISSRCSYPF